VELRTRPIRIRIVGIARVVTGDLGDVDVLDGLVDILFERGNGPPFEGTIEFLQSLLASLECCLAALLPLSFSLTLCIDPRLQSGLPPVVPLVEIRPEGCDQRVDTVHMLDPGEVVCPADRLLDEGIVDGLEGTEFVADVVGRDGGDDGIRIRFRPPRW